MDSFLAATSYANTALNELKQLSLANPVHFPDVILSDIQIPCMNGWQFLEEFQNLHETVLEKYKLFMFSSPADTGDVEKSKTHKAVRGFIPKSLTIEKMNNLK